MCVSFIFVPILASSNEYAKYNLFQLTRLHGTWIPYFPGSFRFPLQEEIPNLAFRPIVTKNTSTMNRRESSLVFMLCILGAAGKKFRSEGTADVLVAGTLSGLNF